MYKYLGATVFIVLLGGTLFLFLTTENIINLALLGETLNVILPNIDPNADIEPQKPLANPPETIKAIYVTNWSAGSEKKMKYLIDLVKNTELNAMVIDIKDYSGYVGYETDIDLVKKYNAEEKRILKPNALIKKLHDEGIYVIGRISIFQDLQLAKARPDLALTSSSTGKTWGDYKGLTWMDPASQEVRDYNILIAKDALERGFDELNFDYIRFASDGNLNDIKYPFWDEKTLKTRVIQEFFKYLRQELADAKLSADLFGLVTINADGLGIGQHLEYALPYFDAIAPMVYPSHYFKGFNGYQNPAEFPYEVVKYYLDRAIERITNYELGIMNKATTTTATSSIIHDSNFIIPVAKLRPWLQDFDLGADYDAAKVRAQIQAAYDAASNTTKFLDGWMLWNASNVYTKEALITNYE